MQFAPESAYSVVEWLLKRFQSRPVIKLDQLSSQFDIQILFSITVTLVGGVVFLLFAITSSIWDPNAESPPGGNWDEAYKYFVPKVRFNESLSRED